MKRFFKNKWLLIGIGCLLVMVLLAALYQAGKYSGFKDGGQTISFVSGNDKFMQSDVTHKLLQSDEGKKEYAKYVLTKVMSQRLQHDDVKISQKDIDNFAKNDANKYAQFNSNPSKKGFEQYVEQQYGSDKEFEEYATDHIIKEKYLNKYLDVDKMTNDLYNTLKNSHYNDVDYAYVSDLKDTEKQALNNNQIPSSIETDHKKISPYDFLREFDEQSFNDYNRMIENDVLYIESNGGYYIFKVTDIKNGYTKNDLNKDIKNDQSFFETPDIEKKLYKNAASYADKHKDILRFNKQFEYSAFTKGVNELVNQEGSEK